MFHINLYKLYCLNLFHNFNSTVRYSNPEISLLFLSFNFKLNIFNNIFFFLNGKI